jgi:hypothetical protein
MSRTLEQTRGKKPRWSTDPAWQDRALAVIETMAAKQKEITADHVWEALGDDRPEDGRALAGVMRLAMAEEVIEPTGQFARSVRRRGSPVQIWRSLRYGRPGVQPMGVAQPEIRYVQVKSDSPLGPDLSLAPGYVCVDWPDTEIVYPGVTVEQVRSLTTEDWDKILDGMRNMKGWARKRMIRAIRYITEGRIYDDPTEDGRTLAAKQQKG